MAKLYSYYTLCPLIDQQNLLGVERDSESGCAIVTLGRNIVIRYKVKYKVVVLITFVYINNNQCCLLSVNDIIHFTVARFKAIK